MDNYESIKLNKQFKYLYAKGKSAVSPSVVVYLKQNRTQTQRLGITTAKKIAKAVGRNRARRLIRVAYRTLMPELNACYDMVIVARTHCVFCSSQEVTKDLKACLYKLGVLSR